MIDHLSGLAHARFLPTQAFTGAPPFGDLESIPAMIAIIQGRRPQRPKHLGVTGSLWELIQQCWDGSPSERPEASEVLEALLASSVSRSLCQPPVR